MLPKSALSLADAVAAPWLRLSPTLVELSDFNTNVPILEA